MKFGDEEDAWGGRKDPVPDFFDRVFSNGFAADSQSVVLVVVGGEDIINLISLPDKRLAH